MVSRRSLWQWLIRNIVLLCNDLSLPRVVTPVLRNGIACPNSLVAVIAGMADAAAAAAVFEIRGLFDARHSILSTRVHLRDASTALQILCICLSKILLLFCEIYTPIIGINWIYIYPGYDLYDPWGGPYSLVTICSAWSTMVIVFPSCGASFGGPLLPPAASPAGLCATPLGSGWLSRWKVWVNKLKYLLIMIINN